MRCIRSSSHRVGTDLPFEHGRGSGPVRWRTIGAVAAVGALLLTGITMLADRDTAEPVRVAQASPTR